MNQKVTLNLSEQFDLFKEFMKKLINLVIFISAFVSNAQRTMFGSQNNFVAPVIPFQAPAIDTHGLVLYLDAANPAS